MTACLRNPFSSLSADNFLSRGAGGQVFIISEHVVFKCPTTFDNPAPEQAEEMKESIKRIASEKAVYNLLMEHRHPNIVQCILCVPEGLFIERMKTTLQARIDEGATESTGTQTRWVKQITSALVWLEELGYAHGDLRPANILLTMEDDIRLADFDASVRTGEQLLVASEPFCKLNEDFEPPNAGSVSEQFALASCIYTIRFGHIPFHELDAPNRVQMLIKSEFPSTTEDILFGDITRKCWLGEYVSIAAVDKDVESCFESGSGISAEVCDETSGLLLAECKEFLAREKSTINDS